MYGQGGRRASRNPQNPWTGDVRCLRWKRHDRCRRNVDGLSTYNFHSDGSGICHATSRFVSTPTNVKLMGDGALVEFASVVDAVRCAVEIQRSMVDLCAVSHSATRGGRSIPMTARRSHRGRQSLRSCRRCTALAPSRVSQAILHTFQQPCCRLPFRQALWPNPVFRHSHLSSRNLLLSIL